MESDMETTSELVSVLNDLIRINNDRSEGYSKAVNELKPTDIDLATLFTKMSDQSTQNAAALSAEVVERGENPARDTTQSGKLYRVWMDIRSGASARDRKSILSLCEFGEDAALKAYHLAIESDVEFPADIRQLILEQKSGLQQSHDTIKRLRDMQEAINL